MPALHISLGTYQKIYNMLERECQILDIQLLANSEIKSSETINLFRKIDNLENSIQSSKEKIDFVHNGIAANIIKIPEKEEEIRRIYTPRLDYLNDKLKKRKINLHLN